MDGVIYAYVNTINDKVYVGQSINFRHRVALHKGDAKRRHTHFYNAVRKDGWENFAVVQLSSGVQTQAELDNLEKIWILLLRSTDRECGYNILAGGNSVGAYNRGKPKSSEHRAKLAVHLKRVWDEKRAAGQKPSGRPRGSKTSAEGIENIKAERSQRHAHIRTAEARCERRRIRAKRERDRRARLREATHELRQNSL